MIERTSSDVVIIGGVAAGPKTGAVLARRSPALNIVLFQREDYLSYASCGLPYFASGDVSSFAQLTRTSYGVERNPMFFKKTKGFDVVTGAEVISIDRDKKLVAVKEAKTGTVRSHGYSRLVIATGARPKTPPFHVPMSPFIRYFTRPDDAISFRKLAERGKIGSLVIIGGGYIGCELAEAATVWGFDTTLVEREPHLLPGGFDGEMAAHSKRALEAAGIAVRTKCEVTGITLSGEKPVVALSDVSITTDYVIICLGVTPESALARECGLAVGEKGGIIVNEHMRTSDPSIYAGGDCVEVRHLLTGGRAYFPLGSLANRHGRVIAENIAGKPAAFPGALGAALVKVCGLNMGCVGLSETQARAEGIACDCIWGGFADKPDYYPDAKEMMLKMVYDKANGRLLGLQAVGTGDICRRIDVFSSMLQRAASVGDLIDFEHGYAPPYSEALDPLHHLASLAEARASGLEMLPPCVASDRYEELIGGKFSWLDIREDEHFSGNKPPLYDHRTVVHIPLNELRERIAELDRSVAYVIMCGRGARSYQAWSILHAAGFAKAFVAGGGLAGAAG
ncbi:MAG TPA: FAD-dependent oxidoreductase [Spirochaetota bacterium]|nr:FAD-dependent oxidoreductase [Spirochaetota bacterium]